MKLNIDYKKVTRLTGISKEIFKEALKKAFPYMNNPKQFSSFLSFLYFCNKNGIINHKEVCSDFYRKETGKIKTIEEKFKTLKALFDNITLVKEFKQSYEAYLSAVQEVSKQKKNNK